MMLRRENSGINNSASNLEISMRDNLVQYSLTIILQSPSVKVKSFCISTRRVWRIQPTFLHCA